MCSRGKQLSCPPTLNSFQQFDPLALTPEQLQRIHDDEHDDMEDIKDYKHGGFMPINLGQGISGNNQFKIIRKLGWGTFSTVWMCRDTLQKRQSYYAIKIAKSSDVDKAYANHEIKVLEHIKSKDPNYVGYNNIVQYHAYFLQQSMFGVHFCIINEMMRQSLLDMLNLNNCQGLEQQGVKLVIKQVINGIRYLHERCGIIHSDIKLENILVSATDSYICNMAVQVEQFKKHGVIMPKSYMSTLQWKQCEKLTSSKIHTKKGPVQYRPVFRDDCGLINKPLEKNKHLLFINPNVQIKIADFGCAIFENKSHPSLVQPSTSRALEVIIQAPYSFPIDMWSVGCLAFELSTGDPLFRARCPPKVPSQDWQLCLIWRAFGKIPKHIALSGEKSDQFFDLRGKFKNVPQVFLRSRGVQQILIRKYGWKPNDALIFEEFVTSLINPDPSLRETALTVYTQRWLQESDY